MDEYLNRLRNEQHKRVRFNIVEDNARFHSSVEIDRWTSGDRRHSLRRHHSQPILRKRYDKAATRWDSGSSATRWTSESSTCATPLKCPKRMFSPPGGDTRWRVSRNHSDSIIHSPPKRRFTSPNSPMLMLASLNCKALLVADLGLPSSPPLQTNEVILDEALKELKADESVDSTKSETDDTSNSGENDEFVPLVQTRNTFKPHQSQQAHSNYLNALLGVLHLGFLWSIFNAMLQHMFTSISRHRENEKSPRMMCKGEHNLEQMEQGDATPLVPSQLYNSPTPSREAYSLAVL